MDFLTLDKIFVLGKFNFTGQKIFCPGRWTRQWWFQIISWICLHKIWNWKGKCTSNSFCGVYFDYIGTFNNNNKTSNYAGFWILHQFQKRLKLISFSVSGLLSKFQTFKIPMKKQKILILLVISISEIQKSWKNIDI